MVRPRKRKRKLNPIDTDNVQVASPKMNYLKSRDSEQDVEDADKMYQGMDIRKALGGPEGGNYENESITTADEVKAKRRRKR